MKKVMKSLLCQILPSRRGEIFRKTSHHPEPINRGRVRGHPVKPVVGPGRAEALLLLGLRIDNSSPLITNLIKVHGLQLRKEKKNPQKIKAQLLLKVVLRLHIRSQKLKKHMSLSKALRSWKKLKRQKILPRLLTLWK